MVKETAATRCISVELIKIYVASHRIRCLLWPFSELRRRFLENESRVRSLRYCRIFSGCPGCRTIRAVNKLLGPLASSFDIYLFKR